MSDGVYIPRIYRVLRLIRRVEEEVARIYPSDKIKSPVHLSIGQESVAVVAATLSMSNWMPLRQSSMYMKLSGELAAAQSGI